jgi:hypothetical protein
MNIGPGYSDVVIATKRTDETYGTKPDGWQVYSYFTKLFLSVIGIIIGATFVIGITLNFIGWIVACAVIGLLLWCCKRYGTNRSVFDRFRYRTTRAQRQIILRRLSDERKPEKN